ncbi:MAG TPA: glycoside hydrolase family 15 protein [Polyangia bacterium]
MVPRSLLLVLVLAAGCGDGGGGDACPGIDCSRHGTCVTAGGAPQCQCDPGYMALGIECQPDPCAARQCGHGSCRPAYGLCECEAGFAGAACDHCAAGYHLEGGDCMPDQPCQTHHCVHGKCHVAGAAELCDCNPGYAGDVCDACDTGWHAEGLTCVADPADACHPNPCTAPNETVCTLDGAGYACACDAGYHAGGAGCVADDACHPNPCTAANRTVCTITGASFTCGCDAGFHLDGAGCVADDACHPNPCTQANQTVCTISGGGHTCACDPGFNPDGSGGCVGADVCHPNPCTELGRATCQLGGAAGYACVCDPGWQLVTERCVPRCGADSDLCTAAHGSWHTLVSSNGHGSVGYDTTAHKATALLEHLYKQWNGTAWTRDMLYDTYLGLRTGGTGTWLNTVTPVREEYLEQTGVIHVVHRQGTLRVDSYYYAPFELGRPALVMLGQVTNEGSAPATASLYTIHNYHVGNTTVADPVNPDATGERVQYVGASYVESGPGGMFLYRPLGAATHHGATPNNPWQALQSAADLGDTADSGVGSDRVAGFQKDFTLAAGQSGWFGVVAAFDRSGDQTQLTTDVENAYGAKDAQAALAEALAGWQAWRTAPPAGLSPQETWVWRQSEAILRQGQVREPTDLSYGQIVASLPPGQWNIAWARDMSYAIVALARTGHLPEAKAALEFMLKAASNKYQSYVGAPYQVSVCRYFGRGEEESDLNADGLNIELDGFGLFLWALAEYAAAGGDTGLLNTYWATIRDRVGNVLAGLTDATTGLVKADSSIWEVHWNGKQKRYTYTSLTAARGLCAAAGLARSRGEPTVADAWETAAAGIRDALRTKSVDGAKALASSYEELTAGSGYRDVASVEAVNWLLFNPAGAVAGATLASFDAHLDVASGHGYFRNDDGGWYDSQEWVWADLRVAQARRLAGSAAAADRLVGWVGAQALANHGMIAELYHPSTGDYEGEVPMVGYGAGAYLMALLDRESPPAALPVCGGWEAP